MNPSLVLRAGASGPTFDPSTPGYVLTVNADGKSVSAQPASGGGGAVDSVFGRTGVVAAVAGDYDASEVTNDSTVAGASVANALNTLKTAGDAAAASITTLSTAPQFPPEHDAGNSGAAINVSVATNLAQKLTLTANCTLTVSGLVAAKAQWSQFKIVQDGTGSRTLAIVGAKTPGGASLTLSAVAGAVDLISLYWDGTTLYAQIAGLAFA